MALLNFSKFMMYFVVVLAICLSLATSALATTANPEVILGRQLKDTKKYPHAFLPYPYSGRGYRNRPYYPHSGRGGYNRRWP
ncbi:hypothetical protein L6164_016384 [Bauhinia variegata]|uniref:Uncharacterized protein n=1 Tax=Bauhinia variegata TaxID=167791 RepID=A0ACB9NUE6_BAUVA|nr:hypothetical protein L6164_016384 [Bauhinia variegata]